MAGAFVDFGILVAKTSYQYASCLADMNPFPKTYAEPNNP